MFNVTGEIVGAVSAFYSRVCDSDNTGIVYVCHRKNGAGFIEYIQHLIVNFAVATAIYFVLLKVLYRK